MVDFEHRVYGKDLSGNYTVLLGSVITKDYSNGAGGTFDTVTGGWYSWIVNSPALNAADAHIYVDNAGWTDGTHSINDPPIPEPTALGLLALGGVAMFRRRRV